jgi:hypothetical protein
MGAVKGRIHRRPGRGGTEILYARVDEDVMAMLDAGASAAGCSRVAYLQELLSRMPRDERGVPPWLHDLVDSQGRLFETSREESDQSAA